MYEKHFGLTEAPFSIAPDPRYLYMSEQHREALAHLLYGIQREGGFVLLTGEVGTGKTTVCRCLLEQIPEDCDVALILNPTLSVDELLSTICDEYRISYPEGNKSIKVFVDLIHAYLLDAHARGRRAILIIDEAQNLRGDVLEQIRLLTNLETNQRKLLQIILLGQPELREKLARDELRQLSQRIVARYHLNPLGRKEVELYIQHRLLVAGSRDRLFSHMAVSEVFHHSKGIPRLVNVICDRALLGAYAEGTASVDRKTIKKAAREVLGVRESWMGHRKALAWYSLGAAILIAGAVYAASHYGLLPNSKGQRMESRAADERAPSAQLRKPIPQAGTPKGTAHPTDAGRSEKAQYASPDQLPSEAGPGEREQRAQHSGTTGTEKPGDSRANPITTAEKLIELARLGGPTQAYQALLKSWGAGFDPSPAAGTACRQAETRGLRCFSGRGGIEELRRWDRPAILSLSGKEGEPLLVTLTALQEQLATFMIGEETVDVPIESVLSRWTGEYTLLWKAPKQFHGDIYPGTRGPIVTWLESELAKTRQEEPGAVSSGIFDDALAAKIRDFQKSNGLEPDGIVGPQTLNRLTLDTDTGAPVLSRMKKDP